MRAIMGGTFDPPHVAHLVAGEAAYQQLGVDVVTFTPAGSPWQKPTDGVSAAEHRWEMTRLAVAGVGYFEADDREVRREGSTYTIETLDSYGDEEIVLILGADAAAGLASWHRGDEVAARAALAVVPRPGTDPVAVERAIEGPFTWLDVPLLDISGTMLRQRSRAGGSIRFLVRDAVWRYVIEHDLYVADSDASS
jgi:nicotinate-nucleotide adenylyltransferase